MLAESLTRVPLSLLGKNIYENRASIHMLSTTFQISMSEYRLCR
jgi:hypothetical protein